MTARPTALSRVQSASAAHVNLRLAEDALDRIRTSSGTIRASSVRSLKALYAHGDELLRYRVVAGVIAGRVTACGRLLEQILREEPSALIRHEAAFGLASFGRRQSIPLLIASTQNDPSDLVRHEAAIALSMLAASEALPYLEAGTRDRSRIVALSCSLAISVIHYKLRKSGAPIRTISPAARTKVRAYTRKIATPRRRNR